MNSAMRVKTTALLDPLRVPPPDLQAQERGEGVVEEEVVVEGMGVEAEAVEVEVIAEEEVAVVTEEAGMVVEELYFKN